MRAIAAAAAAAARKWMYYLAVEGESLGYVINWAHSFDVGNATTWEYTASEDEEESNLYV